MPVTNINDQNRKQEKHRMLIKKDNYRSGSSISNSTTDQLKKLAVDRLDDRQRFNPRNLNLSTMTSKLENQEAKSDLIRDFTVPPLKLPKRRQFLNNYPKKDETKLIYRNGCNSSSDDNDESNIIKMRQSSQYQAESADKSSVFKIEIRNQMAAQSSKRNVHLTEDLNKVSMCSVKPDLINSISKDYLSKLHNHSNLLQTFKPTVSYVSRSELETVDQKVKDGQSHGLNADEMEGLLSLTRKTENCVENFGQKTKNRMTKANKTEYQIDSNRTQIADFLNSVKDVRNQMKTILYKLELISNEEQDIVAHDYSSLYARFLYSTRQYQHFMHQILTATLEAKKNKLKKTSHSAMSSFANTVVNELPVYIDTLNDINDKLISQWADHETFLQLANYALNLIENTKSFFACIAEIFDDDEEKLRRKSDSDLSSTHRKTNFLKTEYGDSEYDFVDKSRSPVAISLDAKDLKFFEFFTPHIKDAVKVVNAAIDDFLIEFETITNFRSELSNIRKNLLAKSKLIVVTTQKLTSLGESLCGCLLNSIELAEKLENFFYESLCSQLRQFVIFVKAAAFVDFHELEAINDVFATLLKISSIVNDLNGFMNKFADKVDKL